MLSSKLIVVAALLISGCAVRSPEQVAATKQANNEKDKAERLQWSPATISSAQRAAVEAAVVRSLKDPESARFGDMVAAAKDDISISVCGFVNAKNSFGGYNGFQPFYVEVVNTGNSLKAIVVSFHGSDEDSIQTRMTCHKRGMKI